MNFPSRLTELKQLFTNIFFTKVDCFLTHACVLIFYGPFIWKKFISLSQDPGKIKRDLCKLGWLAFHMNIIQFYKVFIGIARSRSEPARSTGETGVFPSKLKEAMIIPVFKNKGSLLNAENYRPIFLLSNIDKVYQKLMQKRLNNFLDNCEISAKRASQVNQGSSPPYELSLSHFRTRAYGESKKSSTIEQF